MKNRKLRNTVVMFLASLVCLCLVLHTFDGTGDIPSGGTPNSGLENTDSSTESATELPETELPSELPSEPDSIPESEETENTETAKPNKELTYLEQCELDYVEPPVKRTLEEALEKIRQMSLYYPLLHIVYENAEVYNPSLIAALAGNPEMTDFAAGVLTREPVVTGGFRDDEIPEEYPLFLQWDIRWGYMPYGDTGGNMGSSGCGPTCLSMAIFYLTGDRSCTPDVVAKYSEDNGYYYSGAGTAWALLYDYPKLYGLTSTAVSKSESRLKSELDKGNILICSVKEGNFTSGGHFIVIYDYDENGFKVNDPKCVYTSRLTWTYQQIKNDFKQIWSIGRGDA